MVSGAYLDLERKASPVGEGDQHIRNLPVVHRLVVDLDACLGIVPPRPVANQVLATQVVPTLARVSNRVSCVPVSEVIAAAEPTRRGGGDAGVLSPSR